MIQLVETIPEFNAVAKEVPGMKPRRLEGDHRVVPPRKSDPGAHEHVGIDMGHHHQRTCRHQEELQDHGREVGDGPPGARP